MSEITLLFQSALNLMESILASSFVMLVLTTVFCLVAARIILIFTGRALKKLNLELTLTKFIQAGLRVIVYAIAVLVILDKLGVQTTSLVALFSVFSAAFALAAQDSLSNLCGGILLLFTRPFLVGDYVNAGGVEGIVLEIGLLNTHFITMDNKKITVPNGTISGATITNFSTEGKRRVDIDVAASYDSPVKQTKQAIREAVQATDRVLEDPAPFIRLSAYGESSITYTLRVWCVTADYWDVYYDLLENIKVFFDQDGIVMTYNHMNVHIQPN